MSKIGLVPILIATVISPVVFADCTNGLRSAQSYTVVGSQAIIINGFTKTLIKTFCFVHAGSEVTVLKDSFCSFENGVLYIDGQVCDAREVTVIR